MALKKVPSLSDVAGQLAGTARFVHGEIDRIEEEVVRTKNVSDETILDVLKQLRVMLDSQEKTADSIATYDQYLRRKHGFDSQLIVAFEE